MTDRPMTLADVQHVNPLWRVTQDGLHNKYCANYQGMGSGMTHVCGDSPGELHREILAADARRPALLPHGVDPISGTRCDPAPTRPAHP